LKKRNQLQAVDDDLIEKKMEENKSQTKIEYERAFSHLPCSSEIWLPTQDSLLNIETEIIMPEVPLRLAIVDTYEYELSDDSQQHHRENNHDDTFRKQVRTKQPVYELQPVHVLSCTLTPQENGLALIKIIKKSNWPKVFGLKLAFKNKQFQIHKILPASLAERANVFEVSFRGP
jgi:hypothetical protein